MADGGDEAHEIMQLFSRDILHYDKLIRERGTTWEEIMNSIELDAANLLHSEGEGPIIQILNCHPIWKELFSAQRKLGFSFCDVHLITEEGYIPVHSVFLRGLSPFLDSMLENVNSVSCKYDVLSISLPDIKMAHLKAFLTLIYNGSVCLTAEEDEEDVRNVMKLLQIGEMSLECVPYDSKDSRRRNKLVRGYRHAIPKDDDRYYGKTKSAEAQPVVKDRCSKSASMPKLDVQVTSIIPDPSSSNMTPNIIQPAIVAEMPNNQSVQSDNKNKCIQKQRSMTTRPIRTSKQALTAYVYLERMDEEKIRRLIGSPQKSLETNPTEPKDMPHSKSKSGSQIKTKKSQASKSHLQNFCSAKKKKKNEKDSATKAKRPRTQSENITSETSPSPSCGKPKKPVTVKNKNEKFRPSGRQNPFEVINIGLDSMRDKMSKLKKAALQSQPAVPCNNTININHTTETSSVSVTNQPDSSTIHSVVNAPQPSSEQIPEKISENIVPEEQITRAPKELEQDQISANLMGPNDSSNINADVENESLSGPFSTQPFHPEPSIADEYSIPRKEVDIVSADIILEKSIPADDSSVDAISTGSILTSVHPFEPEPPSPMAPEEEKDEGHGAKDNPSVDPEIKELNDQRLQPLIMSHVPTTTTRPPKSLVVDTNTNRRKEFKKVTSYSPRPRHSHRPRYERQRKGNSPQRPYPSPVMSGSRPTRHTNSRPFRPNPTYHSRPRPSSHSSTYHQPPPQASHPHYQQRQRQQERLPFGNTGHLPPSPQVTSPSFNWDSNYHSNNHHDTFQDTFPLTKFIIRR